MGRKLGGKNKHLQPNTHASCDKLYRWIRTRLRNGQTWPTRREISPYLGFASTNAASYYLDVLVKQGLIERVTPVCPGSKRRPDYRLALESEREAVAVCALARALGVLEEWMLDADALQLVDLVSGVEWRSQG